VPAEAIAAINSAPNTGLGLLTAGHSSSSSSSKSSGSSGSSGGGGSNAGGSALPPPPKMLSGLQLDGQLDIDDMVLGIMTATLVLGLIALLGLLIACTRSTSCLRTPVAIAYFISGLPAWGATGFATAFCFVFRSEAAPHGQDGRPPPQSTRASPSSRSC
jgi:hypothetical protein